MSKTINLESKIKGLKDLIISDILPRVDELNKRKPILLYSLHNPLLRLKQPLAVYLENDSDGVIANCYDIDVFGHGETESDALEDLRKTISDLYFEVESSKDQLGPFPKKIWDYLSSVVEKTEVSD